MVVSRGQAAKAAVTRGFALGHQIRMQIKVGDLTKSVVGAIVNAANERLLGGGGVDGAIHRAAGPRLYEACKAIPQVMPGIRCPTGEARITPGFDLSAAFVVHTVGPIYENDSESAQLLRASHWNSLGVAAREGVTSVAFPAISCGVYGYPVSKAARIAVQACIDFSQEQGPTSPLRDIEFVLFSQDTFSAWVAAAEELTQEQQQGQESVLSRTPPVAPVEEASSASGLSSFPIPDPVISVGTAVETSTAAAVPAAAAKAEAGEEGRGEGEGEGEGGNRGRNTGGRTGRTRNKSHTCSATVS